MKTIAIHNGHGASVAYMKNGEIKFALQEERLTRVKNQAGFPILALKKLLEVNDLELEDIDKFIFSDFATIGIGVEGQDRKYWKRKFQSMFDRKKIRPILNLRQLVKNIITVIPPVKRKFADRFIEKIQSSRILPLLELGVPKEKIIFMDHHTCHASSAGYGWGFNERFVIVTSDGVGDGLSGSISIYEEGKIKRVASIPQSGSLALLYAMTTSYLGMQPLEHEFKLMGMSPYSEGSPQAKVIAKDLHKLFEFDSDGLTYHRKEYIKNETLGPILRDIYKNYRFDQISAGIQIFIEEFVTQWVENILKTLDSKNLALSGGLFMNVKLNKRLMELDSVKNIFVFPSCGDDTNVFGASYKYYFDNTDKLPQPLSSFYLGESFSDNDILSAIKNYSFDNDIDFKLSENITRDTATLLSENKIVARFNGREEFGARALGNRSILANPQSSDVIRTINKMIKMRDFWMPFAPSCININEYFENPKNISSPFMMFTFDSKKDKLEDMRAGIHPQDDTARPQEVLRSTNTQYWEIIKNFGEITGKNILLNTSFNLHGFPIVNSPTDALHVLDNSGLKYLAIGNYLVYKK